MRASCNSHIATHALHIVIGSEGSLVTRPSVRQADQDYSDGFTCPQVQVGRTVSAACLKLLFVPVYGLNLSNLYASSYKPTWSRLIRARQTYPMARGGFDVLRGRDKHP